MDLKIITIEEGAFYELINKVVEKVKADTQVQDRWLDGEEAMRLLRITSKATLQKLRDEGKIRFSQPMVKVVLYDRESILQYIEKHAVEPFNK